jgi:choline dehydrogenase-like flavoprotein
MFFDARQLEQGHTIDADICIIGAGAAGITMAREFIGSTTRVALIESGGLAYDDKSQSLYQGENIGLPSFDLNVNRLRYFGGTTNHWAGHCRPLDAIDFEKRNWIPHSGWPIGRRELDPYYLRAQPIVGLGPYEYENLGFWQNELKLPNLQFNENRLSTVVYNQSPPTRFGQAYRSELKNAANIGVYLSANVLEITSNSNGSKVTSLKLACIDGPTLSATAKIFVLATGGMENARILLLSDRVQPKGLGNDNGLVGRYFMDHILLRPGAEISLSDPNLNLLLYSALHRVHQSQMFAILASPEALLRKEKLNNFRIHLVRRKPFYPAPVGRVMSRLDKVDGAQNPGETGTDPRGHGLDAHELRVAGRDAISLHMVLEPTPNPNSRITLSNKTDLFGQRKIDVNWQLDQKDLPIAYRAMELAALEFGRLGLGRAYAAIFSDATRWPGNLEAGRHHCGTTRMTDDPKTGVVDHNCKLNTVSNLYIAGSSIFPTIGYANPTLSIVALALRLSDHVKVQLSGRQS